MSTINTLTDTNTGSVSMGVINTNFSNLNTDKIEANDTKILTNKTINAANNTIRNLDTTTISVGSKTGSDTFIVTGTKGDANELAQWNSDGDLITTDVSITTAQPSSVSSDVTIPTSKAVYDFVNTNYLATKQIFIQPLYWGGSATQNPNQNLIGNYPHVSISSAVSLLFNFSVPDNFNTLTSAELVMIPDTTETITINQCTVDLNKEGEVYTANTISTGSFTQAVTISQITKVRLDTRTNSPFINMQAGDFGGVLITSGTAALRVLGLLIKYT